MLVKSKNRKEFSRGILIDTLVNQDFKCADCKERFAKGRRPHFDHIDGDASHNSAKNCQALCPNCHDDKTRRENKERAEIQKKNNQDPFYLNPKDFEI